MRELVEIWMTCKSRLQTIELVKHLHLRLQLLQGPWSSMLNEILRENLQMTKYWKLFGLLISTKIILLGRQRFVTC